MIEQHSPTPPCKHSREWFAAQTKPVIPVCRDLDDECPDVTCKTSCWLYDPGRGMCPYLRTEGSFSSQ